MKSIRNKLSLATCSLLTTGNAAAEAIENAWEVDSSYLYYSEDERVTVNKLIGSAKGYVSPKNTASIKVVFDAMSGATPTGAVKSGNPLTSTGASGGTGIGGSTAMAVGERLARLASEERQVLVVTHAPQVVHFSKSIT